MIKNIINLGDSAIYCDFGSEVNREINSQVINYFKNLQKNKIKLIKKWFWKKFMDQAPREVQNSNPV